VRGRSSEGGGAVRGEEQCGSSEGKQRGRRGSEGAVRETHL
jgi:hypothetical protein